MRYRAAYAAAKTLGHTGPESQDTRAAKVCREEIGALWDAQGRWCDDAAGR
jgi:hypothetical protein